MIFRATPLSGAFMIDLERIEDARGFFARSYCQKEFEAKGLEAALVQCSVSYNTRKGTLRGMHYQLEPYAEAKVVRCTRGRLYDVIVDLRSTSPTYCQWTAVELSANNRLALYIPKGMAHGYQTLEDDTEVFYQMSQCYAPQFARGVRWNDAVFQIRWPLDHPLMSEKDRSYPDFRP